MTLLYGKPSGTRDWFMVPWEEVYARTGFAPQDLPGVRELPKGGSEAPPWWHAVHRTHLPIIGYRDEKLVERYGVSAEGTVVLRPHQIEAIEFIRARRGTLLASEQRTGKSAAALYAHDPNDGICLVVGPVASRLIWHEWAARRFGACTDVREMRREHAERVTRRADCSLCARLGATCGQLGASFHALRDRDFDPEAPKRMKPYVTFMSYGLAHAWRELFAHWQIGTLIVDEVHLAGVQSRRSVTFEAIRMMSTVAKRVVMLSGTPMWNRPAGLWPILDALAPTAFGNFWDFARRHADAVPTAHGWKAQGASRLDELTLRLTEIMLRRRWVDIQANLPPVDRSVELVPLTEAQDSAVQETAARLRFAKGGPKTLIGDLARLRRLLAEPKAEAAQGVIHEIISNGHSCVAWTWHKEVAERLAEALRRAGLRVWGPVHGAMPAGARETLVQEARTGPQPSVIVATMASCATAVNFNWCSHEVFVELDWTPAVISQAEMRPYDGARPVSATFMVADTDMDRRLGDALLEKLGVGTAMGLGASVGDTRGILAASLGLQSEQTLEELARLVASNVSEA